MRKSHWFTVFAIPVVVLAGPSPLLLDPELRGETRGWGAPPVMAPVEGEHPPVAQPPGTIDAWNSPAVTIVDIQFLGGGKDVAAFLALKDGMGEPLSDALLNACRGTKTAEDLRSIAKTYTRKLIEHGYLLAWIAPEGTVRDGVMTWRVAMGRVGEVAVVDAAQLKWQTADRIQDRLA